MTAFEDFVIETSVVRGPGDEFSPLATPWIIHGGYDGEPGFEVGFLIVNPRAVGVDIKQGASAFGIEQERTAMASFLFANGNEEKRWAILTHISGKAPGRAGALLTASSILQSIELLGIEELVALSTLRGDTRALAHLDPDAQAPGIRLSTRQRAAAFATIEAQINSSATPSTSSRSRAARSHLYAL